MLNRNNIEHELDKIMECSDISDYDIEVTLSVTGLNEKSDTCLKVNDQTIHSGYLTDGEHTLQQKVQVPGDRTLELSLHTSTHNHGQKVSVEGIRINGVDLLKSHQFIWDMFKFTHTDGKVEEQNNGLYHNGLWNLSMPTPLFPWLTKERNKRSNVEYRAHLNFDMDGEDYYKLLDNVFR